MRNQKMVEAIVKGIMLNESMTKEEKLEFLTEVGITEKEIQDLGY